MEKPLFPTGDRPEVSEVADWCECVVLAEASEFKRGDLKSAISQEDVQNPDMLEQQVWTELEARSELFGDRWPLVLEQNRLRLRSADASDPINFYKYLCLLGLGQAESADRILFEELVCDVVASRVGPTAVRVGHPASHGSDPSFRERISKYAAQSGMKQIEVPSAPFPNDKDLGLDVVFWLPFPDRRGADLHFLIQCATGRNWGSKFDDINIDEWRLHLNWAVPPVRMFCVPNVIRLAEEQWIRASKRAGWIVDRPRLLEFAQTVTFTDDVRARVSDRVSELSVA
ncbi:hypothetical protein [Cellulomonas sp. Leaf334]|uniref:hypothetical protein n=1 Tax=Cellulomonas sp. Leaf334 TaxID=1736339 RepID=UPI000AE1F4DE|nr:hypothetical protein [Cellulomonas sp. Leaf334]